MKVLVSVRSADEATAALLGGADLIDVKEPSRGSLGRADDKTMLAIAQAVDGRTHLSVAMGELKDVAELSLPAFKCDFIKFGLSGCRGLSWRERLNDWRQETSTTLVPTAYADFLMAAAPPVSEVLDFVVANRFPVLLIDTFGKDGRSLFDWLTQQQLRKMADELRGAGADLALAGSLKTEHLPKLRAINPTWLAVRGAVCKGSNRTGEIDSALVRSLKTSIDASR